MRRAVALLTCVGLLGCGDLRDAYGKEYVLYDSSRQRPAGATPVQPGTSSAEAAEGFPRILVLEHVLGELERAILDGEDPDGALARKRQQVDAELRRRIAEAGTKVQEWRAARVAELRQFPVR